MVGQLSWKGRICRVVFALLLLLLCLAGQSDVNDPFGLPTIAAAANDRWRATWQTLQSQIDLEKPIIASCRKEPASCGSPAALRFIAIVNEGAGHEGTSRIGRINRAANVALRPKDQATWTSPVAALAAGEGDCKQFAILKYAAMIDAGFAPDDLRLILGQIISQASGHAVVAVRRDGRWLILDSRSLELVESHEFPDYLPLYAFDYRGVRRFVLPSTPKIAGAACAAGTG